jgi:hypothetical protein
MIRHQAIGMYTAAIFGGLLIQGIKVERVVAVIVEAGAAIIFALDDMPGYAGYDQADTTWHSGFLSMRG